jgi:YggT family protein
MGASATVSVLADAITNVERFVYVFVSVYGLLILAYIIMSWIRMPYSVWMSRIQGFLRDVCEPYLRLFRRVLPPLGPLDLSPMIGIFTLYLVARLVVYVLDRFH